MSLKPFYDTYLIDDENIACNRIIAVKCDWTHVYIDPCDILLECFDWRPQIDWCSMVNPIDDDNQPWIPWASWWYVLRVKNDGSCVEFVPPDVAFPFTDRLVTVSDNDTTPWTLIQKIVSCNEDILQIQEINDWDNELLQLCITVPDSFLDLSDTPNAYVCTWISYTNTVPENRWFVMMSTTWTSFECDGRQLWGSYYRTTDMIFTYETQHNWNFPTWWKPIFEFFWYLPVPSRWYTPPYVMDYYEGNPDMNNGNGVIRIPRTGMYKIEAHVQARVNRWYESLRAIILLVWDSWVKVLGADDKFWEDTRSGMVNLAMPNTNYSFVSMQPQNLVRLDAGTLVTLGIRSSIYLDLATILHARDNVWNINIDADPSNRQSNIRLFRSSLARWVWPWNPDDGSDLNKPFSWLTFRVYYYWPYLYNAT